MLTISTTIYNVAFLALHDASSFVGYGMMMSVSGQFYSLVCVRDICSFFPPEYLHILRCHRGADKGGISDFSNAFKVIENRLLDLALLCLDHLLDYFNSIT